MNGFLRFALGLANMPDATVADLEKSMPGLSRLVAAAKEAEPILTEAKPHLDALEPLAIKLMPILQKAWPDIVAVTPTVEELIQFASQKGI